MSEPYIARRCKSCGASIRERAFFCPQCGKSLTDSMEPKSGSEAGQANHPKAAVTAPLNEVPGKKEQLDTKPKTKNSVKPLPPRRRDASGTPSAKSAEGPVSSVLAGARDKVQRATGVARHVGGDVVQRGQKLREISHVVRDEAAYDPSLRFVLVAAVLFVLFLVMVLLNRFIT